MGDEKRIDEQVMPDAFWDIQGTNPTRLTPQELTHRKLQQLAIDAQNMSRELPYLMAAEFPQDSKEATLILEINAALSQIRATLLTRIRG